ncbi:hypothetical protein AOLI_G00278140 [Acnodon oligacanthus]
MAGNSGSSQSLYLPALLQINRDEFSAIKEQSESDGQGLPGGPSSAQIAVHLQLCSPPSRVSVCVHYHNPPLSLPDHGTQKSRFLERTRYYRSHCGERTSSRCPLYSAVGCQFSSTVTATGLDQHPNTYDPLQLTIA